MFAIKQVVRSLSSYRILPSAAAKVRLCRPASYILQIQSSPAVPNACFSCSTKYLESALEKISRETDASFQNPPPPEPDVLYHMIEVEIRGSDKIVLQSYNRAISLVAEHLGLTIGLCEVAKKPHIKRWTVLKSRFVHKKHYVSYEVRTYHHKLRINRITGSTADTFLEYIQRNLPEGVAMRVERERMEKIPEHLLTPPPQED